MMKQTTNGKTLKKKRILYSCIFASCFLLLAAATTLTVYFVSTSNNEVLENGGQGNQQNPDDGNGQQKPEEPNKPDEPNKPSSGNEALSFLSPVENASCSVEYDSIYTNLTLNQIRKHKGMDFSAEEGASVVAVAKGKVESISYSQELGNLIVLDHGDGLKSYYRFVEPVSGLKEGAEVSRGEEIARVAAAYGTEHKDGTHLHFEMKLNEEWKDPSDYFDITYEEK